MRAKNILQREGGHEEIKFGLYRNSIEENPKSLKYCLNNYFKHALKEIEIFG